MSQSSIFGTCESCGKKFRVPSADKTYPCKACGGDVHVAELVDATTARDRYVSGRRPDRNSIPLIPIILVMLVVTGFGLGGYQMGLFGQVFGAGLDPRLKDLDITQANEALVAAWAEGDMEALTLMHHPTGRDLFERRLGLISAHRGWETKWPSLQVHKAELEGGTAEAPEKGVSSAGAVGLFLRTQWQYDGNVERWFLYDLWISPTALEARAEEFRDAWKTSDSAELRQFFAPSTADKMEQLFTKSLAKAGWKGSHPDLGVGALSGEKQAETPAGEHFGVKVSSVFPIDDGQVTIGWKFYQPADHWVISGLKF